MAEQEVYEHYYVPDQSRLPVWTALGMFLMVFGLGTVFNDMSAGVQDSNSHYIAIGGFALMAYVLYIWFSTAIQENLKGMNSAQLKRSYVWGMGWFIFSEVMFFAAFFGALFYVRNFAVPWLGGEGDKAISNYIWPGFEAVWPVVVTPEMASGVGVGGQAIQFKGDFELVDPWHLPLYNTLLLLTSSVTCHFAHTALKQGNFSKFKLMLAITVGLGIAFLALQIEEYAEAYSTLGLTLESGIYGSTFFLLTGFHGFHVTLGAFMLSVMLIRGMKGQFKTDDHFGFEAASWYWHFVDVVWVGLFIFVYVF